MNTKAREQLRRISGDWLQTRLLESLRWRYGVAVFSTLTALAITYLLQPFVFRTPLFFLAILVSAWIGDKGPGLLAVIMATLSITLVFNPDGIVPTRFENAPNIAAFPVTALLVYWWSLKRRQAEHALRQAQAELEARVQERTSDLLQSNDRLKNEIAERLRAETSLSENEVKYRGMFEAAHDVLVLVDKHGHIIEINHRAEHVLGYSGAELLHMNVFQGLYMPEDRPMMQSVLEDVMKGQAREYEVRWLRKDGTIVYFDGVSASRFSATGEFLSTICALRDITEKKQTEAALRRSEECFRAMIEHSTDGIVLLTAEGGITYASPGASRILGYTVEESRRLNRFDLLHPDDREQLTDEWNKLLQQPGETSENQYRLRHKNGSWVWVERILHNLLLNPSVEAIVINYRDISERKRAEEALQKYTRRLETRHEIDEGIIKARSLDEIAKAVLNLVTALVPCQRAGIMLFDFETRQSTVHAAYYKGESRFALKSPIEFADLWKINEKLSELRQGQVLVVDDMNTLPPYPGVQRTLKEGIQSEVIAPLLVQGELIGTFDVGSDHQSGFGPTDVEIICEMADSLAIAIGQIRLFEHVSEKRHQLRLLTQKLVDTQEAERHILARELHDQVGTNLTVLGINLNVLKSELSSRVARKVEARLTDSLKLLDEAQDSIRDVMTSLHPSVLDDYGLEAALRWYAEQFSYRVRLEAVVRSTGLLSRLPPEIEIGLFRITQEALTNVAKHAQATHIRISFEKQEEEICLTISDDGVGFNPSEPLESGKQRGMGLMSMMERAESLKGRLRVDSLPGKGTQVIVEVPLIDQHAAASR